LFVTGISIGRFNVEGGKVMKSKHTGSKRNRRERGMALMITAIAMLFVVPFVGLSIDAGLAYVVRGRLSAALDSAALAAGRGLNLGTDIPTAQSSAITAATNFFNANFPPGYMGTDPAARTINATFNMRTDSNGNPDGILVIGVTGTVAAPTYFSKLLGFNNFSISATGTATRRTLVMSLLLDISASMGSRDTPVGTIPSSIDNSSSSCEAMVYSSIQFINYFSPYDYVGMIAFDYTAHLKYAMSTNFKQSGNGGVIQQIANLNCGNNTNTTAALELGYQQIKNTGLPLAENTIVLFTDGVPNGVTANFPVRTSVTRGSVRPATAPARPMFRLATMRIAWTVPDRRSVRICRLPAETRRQRYMASSPKPRASTSTPAGAAVSTRHSTRTEVRASPPAVPPRE
jgi:Flp pilus assembly protein TadG